MTIEMSGSERKRLVNTALGREKADITLTNTVLVNVYTGEIIPETDVAVSGRWIAYVGRDASHTVGEATRVVDGKGLILAPGFIDSHTHLAWLSSIHELLPYAMVDGVTTLVTESMEPFPVGGMAGVNDFLHSLADQPINIFATAPPMMSISTTARGIDPEDLQGLLDRKDIVGLGEAYWQGALQEIDRMLPLFEKTLAAGKFLEGHSAGASERKLNAYFSTGISSCHEPITTDEVLARIRLGVYVMIREGSIRRDLDAVRDIVDRVPDSRRLILVTDGVSPMDLLEKGYMAVVIQKAVDLGMNPVTAIQMATLNAAEHFGLAGVLGGIAPGRQADMVLLPDLATISPRMVICRGVPIVEDGRLLTAPRRHEYTESSLRSVHLEAPCRPDDFRISVDAEATSARVRVMDLITELVTREKVMTLPVQCGEIRSDPGRDLLKVAAIERTQVPGRRFAGLIRGFGMRSGAIASSAAWDTADIVVVGADEGDMADAVNRVRQLQGGAVVCRGGRVLAELPLPILGILSDLPMAELAETIASVSRAAVRLGFPYADPLLTLVTLSGQAIPFLRICEEGLVNFKDGITRGLLVDEDS